MPPLLGRTIACCGDKSTATRQNAPVRPDDLEMPGFDHTPIMGKERRESQAAQRQQEYEAARRNDNDGYGDYFLFGKLNPGTELGFDPPQENYTTLFNRYKDEPPQNKFVDSDFVADRASDDIPKAANPFPAVRDLPPLRPVPKAQRVTRWLRPRALVKTPPLFVQGDEGYHKPMRQGYLGDCWFVSTVNAIMRTPTLAARVIPPGQNFDAGNYAGIFRFRLWRFGYWVEVYVDDYLPGVRDKETGATISYYSMWSDEGEMWGPLLEKALAKVMGGYQMLIGGRASEAMEYLTGGLVQTFRTMDPFFDARWLARMWTMSAIMAAGTPPVPKRGTNIKSIIKSPMQIALEKCRLRFGHSYSVLATATIRFADLGLDVLYLRLQNPHGKRNQSRTICHPQQSEAWDIPGIPAEVNDQFPLILGSMWGEIWLPFCDFRKLFVQVYMAHMETKTFPLKLQYGQLPVASVNQWEPFLEFSEWIVGQTVGGNVALLFELNDDPNDPLQSRPPRRVERLTLTEAKRNLTMPKMYAVLDPATPPTNAKRCIFDTGLLDLTPLVVGRELGAGCFILVACAIDEINCEFLLRFYVESPTP